MLHSRSPREAPSEAASAINKPDHFNFLFFFHHYSFAFKTPQIIIKQNINHKGNISISLGSALAGEKSN